MWFAVFETKVEDQPQEVWDNVKPDSLREPHHFDWENNRYVYKDQIVEDSVVVDWGPLTSTPDYSVKIANGYQPPRPRLIRQPGTSLGGSGIRRRQALDLPEIKLNGKIYRQRERADGIIQLIPIR